MKRRLGSEPMPWSPESSSAFCAGNADSDLGRRHAVHDDAWGKIQGSGSKLKRIPPRFQVRQIEARNQSSDANRVNHPWASAQLHLQRIGSLFRDLHPYRNIFELDWNGYRAYGGAGGEERHGPNQPGQHQRAQLQADIGNQRPVDSMGWALMIVA